MIYIVQKGGAGISCFQPSYYSFLIQAKDDYYMTGIFLNGATHLLETSLPFLEGTTHTIQLQNL